MIWRRVSCVVVCLALQGCWSSPQLIDNTFTDEEWQMLQQFSLPEPDLCPEPFVGGYCDVAAKLGKRMFFDRALSGPIDIDDPYALGVMGEVGKISCASCHDSQRSFVDVRSQPNQVSIGAMYTKHNALGLINTDLKRLVANRICRDDDRFLCRNVFTWNGQFTNPRDVLELALGEKAMNRPPPEFVEIVRVRYGADYANLFHRTPCPIYDVHPLAEQAETLTQCDPSDVAFENIKDVFAAYERRLTNKSAFDRYMAGDFTALGSDAKRGLALFIGKAMCVDCHNGPLLSDLQFHNTGTPQRGTHVDAIDGGLDDCLFGGFCAPKLVADDTDPHRYLGMFLTQPLRNISETAPYMHDGVFATLADVIEFYRRGGVSEGYSGVKDPRMQPIDLTDDEALDLEAFLYALKGDSIDPAWTEPEP